MNFRLSLELTRSCRVPSLGSGATLTAEEDTEGGEGERGEADTLLPTEGGGDGEGVGEGDVILAAAATAAGEWRRRSGDNEEDLAQGRTRPAATDNRRRHLGSCEGVEMRNEGGQQMTQHSNLLRHHRGPV